MNEQILEFVTQQKLKSYFYASSPYVMVDGHEVPVLQTNNQIKYGEDLQNEFYHTNFPVEKFTVPEQYYNLVVHCNSTGQLVLLKDCVIETLKFSRINKDPMVLFISFRSFETIVAEIRYRVGNALYVFERMFSTGKAPTKTFYENECRVFDGRFFRGFGNNTMFRLSDNSLRNYKIEAHNLGIRKVPLYLFDKNPTLVIVAGQKVASTKKLKEDAPDSYYRITGGVNMLGFAVKLTKGTLPENTNTSIIAQVVHIKKLTAHDLRIMFIDSILNDI